MRLLIFLFFSIALNASMLDFLTLDEAKKAYEEKEYEKAVKAYEKVARNGNDEARFNLGDSYYRQKKYKEALESFSQITDPALQYRKLHNMGNCYANLGKTDEGIKAYEEALTLHKDPDTEHNLELLKQQKKKEEKKQDQDQQNSDKDNQDEQDKKSEQQKGQEQNDQQKQSKRDSDDKRSERDQKNSKENQKEDQARSDEEKKAKDEQKREEEERAAMEQAKAKKAPISDMEERKYKKLLQGRGVNTLMLPIETKGENEDETKPW